MQKCKGERGRRPREDGVQSTEYGRVAKTVRRLMTKTGRGGTASRPSCILRQGRGFAAPFLVRRSRRSLAPTRGRSPREATRLARSANPTSIHSKKGTGERDVSGRLESPMHCLTANH